MGLFERYLSLWVALSIVSGMLLGVVFPDIFAIIASLEWAHVNLLVALLIWMMIYPMMVQVDVSTIRKIGRQPQGMLLTLVINWLIKPFTMAALGWLFFKVIFDGWVDPQTANEYIAGMILLGVAPCTAMVFIWSQLTKGDATFTLLQVSLNDIIMIFAFAPIAALLLGLTDLTVPWETLILSVMLYVVLPLAAGIVTRNKILKRQQGTHDLQALLDKLKPWSIFGLLMMVVLLFGFQAESILQQTVAIVLIAIPLLIQAYGIFAIGYLAAFKLRLPHQIAAPACLIGTSNFFELSVAVAISLFGLHSGAALATVVGVLVEVPVMLSLVWLANRTRGFFPDLYQKDLK